MSTKKPIKSLTRHETIYIALAVRDAYLGFDQEDYCDKNISKDTTKSCGKCFGCLKYNNLKRVYKIIKKLLPRR